MHTQPTTDTLAKLARIDDKINRYLIAKVLTSSQDGGYYDNKIDILECARDGVIDDFIGE